MVILLYFLPLFISSFCFGSKHSFNLNYSDSWKVDSIEDLCRQVEINAVGLFMFKQVAYDYSLMVQDIHNRGIASSVIMFDSKHFYNTRQLLTRLLKINISYIIVPQEAKEIADETWKRMNDYFCDAFRWVIFIDIRDTENINRKIDEATECQIHNWKMVSQVNASSRTKISPKRYHIYSFCPTTICKNNDKFNSSVFLTSLKRHKNFRKAVSWQHHLDEIAVTVRVTSVECPPYLFMNKTDDGKYQLVRGLEVRLLKLLQQKYHFRYEVTSPKDGEWGRKLNGSWTGMIGMVNRKEADIAISCISETYERREACDFTIPYNEQIGVLTTKFPEPKSKVYAVLMPFPLQLWIFLFTSFLISGLALYIIGKVNSLMDIPKTPNLYWGLWYLFSVFLSQGGSVKIFRTATALTIFGIWLLVAVIFQACYKSLLMSFMSFPGLDPTIDTLQDLADAVKYSSYKCGTLKGTSYYVTLKHLQDRLLPISEAFLKDQSNTVATPEEGMAKVLTDKYTFLYPLGEVEYIANIMGKHQFYISSVRVDTEHLAIAMRPEFPYKHHFNSLIRRAIETGLVELWKQEFDSFAKETLQLKEDQMTPLSLSDLKGALLLCCYGWALSVLSLLAECFMSKFILKEHFKCSTSQPK